MIAATKHYQYVKGRDELALLSVTAQLSYVLANDIYVDDMEDHEDEDFNRSTPEQRIENAQKATMLHKNLSTSISIGTFNADQTLNILTDCFGIRIPKDASLIQQEHQSPINPLDEVNRAPAIIRQNSVQITSQSSG